MKQKLALRTLIIVEVTCEIETDFEIKTADYR